MVMNFGFCKIKPYVHTPGSKITQHRQDVNEKAVHEMNMIAIKEKTF
jgi:hypothetical protein